jgi:hypothetical protein
MHCPLATLTRDQSRATHFGLIYNRFVFENQILRFIILRNEFEDVWIEAANPIYLTLENLFLVLFSIFSSQTLLFALTITTDVINESQRTNFQSGNKVINTVYGFTWGLCSRKSGFDEGSLARFRNREFQSLQKRFVDDIR